MLGKKVWLMADGFMSNTNFGKRMEWQKCMDSAF